MKKCVLNTIVCCIFFGTSAYADELPANPWKSVGSARTKNTVSKTQNELSSYLESQQVPYQIQNYSSEVSSYIAEQGALRVNQLQKNRARLLEAEKKRLQQKAERQKQLAKEQAKGDDDFMSQIGSFFADDGGSSKQNAAPQKSNNDDGDWLGEYDDFVDDTGRKIEKMKKDFSKELSKAKGNIMKLIE